MEAEGGWAEEKQINDSFVVMSGCFMGRPGCE